ncbi:3-hydroxypropionyl-CoA synthetase [Thiohalorhabdus denitrificans]|uniref:Acetyl-coenzyme A synthetase n=1 Tax=Thiohalorhabdus denitrificans TaxID=381306 RepID=A0A0P9EPY7_9GAMM|nr:acetate--CoA ligase [Thiohalorhabdus denitrificans]KPV40566.1 3-hydroxypropionyl-CoA synthetase [Thiohalorhabdus denitrificans]SCY51179.1 acetyl-coenzyme A synthetase [Thiohalorhabdus denitrificans]
MTDETLETVLTENRVFEVPAEFAEHARIAGMEQYLDMARQATQDYEGFWAEQARQEITWSKPFSQVLDESNPPFYKWFADGTLNVSYNCLDRHIEAGNGDRPAILWEGEPGDTRNFTYAELLEEVGKLGNALKSYGVEKGDRVVIYMPMVPEAVVAMQACARIGATHSVVFGGFSAEALKDRIEDAGAKVVITADGGIRGGKTVALKKNVDRALNEGCDTVEHVVVLQRAENEIDWTEGRDVWFREIMERESADCAPEPVEAEHPLFILYTSGSTGKPKGVVHSSAGYLLGAITSMKWVFDIGEDDVYWCTADVGWITGHTYIAYGPMAVGATQVMYEGAPTVPDPGRLWSIAERTGTTVFYTAPTAIRALMKQGDEWPNKHDLSKLRLLGTVGEPINPAAWMWYYQVIGGGRCPIVDTWWQTETGSHMISPLPGAVPLKPGSCTLPLPGVMADVVDEEGNTVEPGSHHGGLLVLRRPVPSMLRTVWGDDQRYIDTYWSHFPDQYMYLAGDSATRDEDGYFWILGRIDDVINVSGHRMGTMEVESALVAHDKVAEAAVVGRPDEVKGNSIFAFVILQGKREDEDLEALREALRAHVTDEIGAIARPDEIRFADALPKTRSGKIMRRLLRTIASGEEVTQDISTLEDENVVRQLQGKA